MLVAFLLALISFGTRLEAKPKHRDRVKPRVQKIKKKKPKKRYQSKKRQPKYQLKRRKKRGFISPKVYKKQQRERRRKLKQKKAIPKRKLRRINKPTTNNNKKIQMNKNKVNINKKGRAKKQCDKLCQHRMRHIQQLLRLGLDTTDSNDLRLRTPFNKRNKLKKRGQ